MKEFIKQFLAYVLSAAIMVASPGVAVGQSQTPAAKPASTAKVAPNAGDPWPRVIDSNGATISIYQPQVESWTGNVLKAYTAVKVKTAGKTATDYGVIWFTANTEVDKVNRVVTLTNFNITKQNFPTLPNNGKSYASAFTGELPWNQTIPLDLLESDLAINGDASALKKYAVQNDPPKIIYSASPAVLALIDGKPVLGPEQDHLQKVVNTRALIVYDTSKYSYYVALMDGWMEAPTIEGPYTVARHAPTKDLKKIEDAAQKSDSNQPLGNPQQSLEEAYGEDEVPTVYVSTTPAELLITQGQPQLTPILGTSLLYVSNTGNDIFMDSGNNNYYVLLAGRWFSGASLQSGPWAYVAGSSLPTDFAKIPASNPKASVLVSVPGTAQAKEALIANSIPQTAAINRTGATLNVSYSGAPDFQPIPETQLTYAVNTATPVVYVPSAGGYYACFEGRMVHVHECDRTVDSCDERASGDLYDSGKFSGALRDLCAGVRIYAFGGVRGLYAWILRDGGVVGRRSRVRHRIQLRAVRYECLLGAGALHLRRGSRIWLERGGGMGPGVWGGHGGGSLLQPVVGPGRLLGLGLCGSGMGLGRLRRRCRCQRLWTVGQYGVCGHAGCVGESLYRERGDSGTRDLLQPGDGELGLRGTRSELQRVHRHGTDWNQR